jgi:hypothetical protein
MGSSTINIFRMGQSIELYYYYYRLESIKGVGSTDPNVKCTKTKLTNSFSPEINPCVGWVRLNLLR